MENPSKKLCVDEKASEENGTPEGITTSTVPLKTFHSVNLEKILNQNDQQKTIFLSARLKESPHDCVVILEKKPFDLQTVEKILSVETTLQPIFQNDIYSSYQGLTSPELNTLKVTVIHPATEQHLQKYTAQELHLINETPEIYQNVVLPHIQQQQFSLQWVYNILEHKSESDRILFEDADKENGFILLPDLKWDGKTSDQLYVLAILHRRDLKSIRDLTATHIPLLQNIKDKSLSVIHEKFGLPPDQVRLYLHYQPSYYHLHIHICALKYEAPGIQCERGHLLDTVISNLNLMSDYYSRATLTYVLTESSKLYTKLKGAL